jgi:hypothetical protein
MEFDVMVRKGSESLRFIDKMASTAENGSLASFISKKHPFEEMAL